MARPGWGVGSGGFFVLHSSEVMFLYLIRVGSGGGGCCLFSSPSGCQCLHTLGHFFVLCMSAMASLVGWCLCWWVGWGVSGVVGGSSSSAFDYLDFSMDSTLVWIGV